MKKHIEFSIADPLAVLSLTNDYFLRSGFKKISQTEKQVSFVKGSTLLNMVTFNPLNWKSRITVALQSDQVVADFDINTVGQMVTPEEERLWEVFIQNFEKSLTEKVDLSEENRRQIRDTKRNTWLYVLWAFIGAVMVGIPCGFLAYYTGLPIIAPIGAAIGGSMYLMKKISDRKKASVTEKN